MKYILGIILLLIPFKAFGCTGILIQATDLSSVNGRTLEFGIPLDVSLSFIPRNYYFDVKTTLGSGMSYTSKYAAIGTSCFDYPALIDGINEKGLSAGVFYFSGYASYSKLTQRNHSKALSPIDFCNWILTQFATLEEVKDALSSVIITESIVVTGEVLKKWGNRQLPLHYIVYDRSGKSIVIEPLLEGLKVYDNPIGVITNSPTFDWHLTNLNNYVNLSPYGTASNPLGEMQLHSLGLGSGMLGLPGDFTPPSRFVRAAFFSKHAVAVASSSNAVDLTFHILNQFDIPKGSVRQKENASVECDYTLMTSVKNAETIEYFYRTYADQRIKFLRLHDFDLNAKLIKNMKIDGTEVKLNVSSHL